jgi:hypothetical protein
MDLLLSFIGTGLYKLDLVACKDLKFGIGFILRPLAFQKLWLALFNKNN